MLNPLSIEVGQKITGREINEWCKDQIKNQKSHRRQAEYLLSKNYKDERTYCKGLKVETGGGIKPHVIIFEKCEEEDNNANY